MSDIRQIQKRMKTISAAKKTTDAVYLLSSARLTSLKPVEELSDRRRLALEQILSSLPAKSVASVPLSAPRGGRDAVFVFASDRGLAGDYNKSVAEKAVSLAGENTVFYVYGSRAEDYFRDCGVPFVSVGTDAELKPSKTAKRLSEKFAQEFRSGEICSLTAVFGERVRASSEPQAQQVLPLAITPGETADTEFIPSAEEIASTVSEEYFDALILRILIKGFIAEHTARMEAMDNASDGAGQLLDELGVTYNRLRQNAITTEIASLAGERIKK